MGRSRELREHMEEAFDYAFSEGFDCMEELEHNYAKYHKKFVGFTCVDPKFDVNMFMRERDNEEQNIF
jgi:hypothetical protein|tara:strand:- start:1011 stop:1214 length:204 start_codon:yes stop_codon:yes gene_type:complete